MRCSRLCVFLLLLIACAWPAVNGSLSGVVRDATGAVVPKADIKATNVDTNVTNTAVTDSLGAYSFLSLPVGRYSPEVKAELPALGTNGQYAQH